MPQTFLKTFLDRCFLRFNLALWVIFFFGGCNHVSLPKEALRVKEYPSVFQSYTTDIVIPFNVAPLNFKLLNPAKRVSVGDFSFNAQKQVVDSLIVKGRSSYINFPLKKWKKLLACAKGSYIEIRTFVQEKELWIRYQPLR